MYLHEFFLIVDLLTNGFFYICSDLTLNHIVFLADALDADSTFLAKLVHACSAAQQTFP